MYKTYTSFFSEYTLFVVVFFVSVFSACSTPTDSELKESRVTKQPVATKKATPVTVAAIQRTSDEVYFDLIAETQNCLGEDLWLGGKLESTDKIVFNDSGAFSKSKEFKVTELTATGLNSNNPYQVSNVLKAQYDDNGVIYLQLSEGQMQLKPYPSAAPIVVAYQPDPNDSYSNGTIGDWTCN